MRDAREERHTPRLEAGLDPVQDLREEGVGLDAQASRLDEGVKGAAELRPLAPVGGRHPSVSEHGLPEAGKALPDLVERLPAVVCTRLHREASLPPPDGRLATVSTDDPARLADPPPWGYSLANVSELIRGCLDAVSARSVLEIGAHDGNLTVELLAWARDRGGEVATVDPDPPAKLLERSREHPELVLHRATSHEVLAGLESLPDAVIVDGDHNYYTLTEELRLIAELAGDDPLPLLIFHDVGWPHARRDTYYDVERIPETGRAPSGIGRDAGLVPGNPETHLMGIPYPWAALREGGPRNGTLTAIEDFIEGRSHLRLALIPAFFGLGVLWPAGIEGADRLAELLAPYDHNSFLGRLEANRIGHLSASHARGVRISELQEQIAELEDRVRRHQHLLRQLLASRAFTVAEYVSRAYKRGEPTFSRETLRRELER